MSSELADKYKKQLIKAISRLDYSYNKVQSLNVDVENMDNETLETWESFTARFARVVDLFSTKYTRAYLLTMDPGYEGSLFDSLLKMEKANFIDSARDWLELRKLRNITAHEYSDEELGAFLNEVRERTPFVLGLRDKLV